ncbi:PepSY domain-containing protein [Robertkochia solimangrovi]|uniref:PepSY domain-containing protein n=1 Tax=Robertkochia solimangrovi TaxID=2213046 RepID=UPI00117C5406|nr:PepSY domain-containing protein [Robertkochia solimangrovi]TRZ41175.1 FAD-binding oxidoreductase [Robertkochia solimangrovi]
MNRTLWRYSHFALAISSSVFVFLAAVTGFILAFEPVGKQLNENRVSGWDSVPLKATIDSLQSHYEEVLTLEVDPNGFIKASLFDGAQDLNGDFLIDPRTGNVLGEVPKQSAFFEFVTSLHRSLFLETAGRIFMGITAFLLFLIAFSGSILIIKRQKGWIKFFKRIVKENFYQYSHIILGRLMLIPLLVITLSGVFLSLDRFEIFGSAKDRSSGKTVALTVGDNDTADFLNKVGLGDIRSVEFPFTDEPEDVFVVYLNDRKLEIRQSDGYIQQSAMFPFTALVHSASFDLHTGNGSLLWSLILAFSALNILYFMYSGAQISWKRLRNRIGNKFHPDLADTVILYGSENGSTLQFVKVLQKAMIKSGSKVYAAELNDYRKFLSLKKLIILTSTYGEGDPPANAVHFFDLLSDHRLPEKVKTSVVGFGSRSYANFCKYAVDVDLQMKKLGARNMVEPYLIHNRNYASFKKWVRSLEQNLGTHLDLPATIDIEHTPEHAFDVVEKKVVQDRFDTTFMLKLKPVRKLKIRSGDLIGVCPPGEDTERMYSVGFDALGHVLLSIKLHERGLCSNYLYEHKGGDQLKGSVHRNSSFHLPGSKIPVICIANGTGIAPFMGMVNERRGKNMAPVQLYWGGRTSESFDLYRPGIDEAIREGRLTEVNLAFSKEQDVHYHYVQDLLKSTGNTVVAHLEAGGVIMICGSVTMQNGVYEVIESLCGTHNSHPLLHYLNKGQILSDCY